MNTALPIELLIKSGVTRNLIKVVRPALRKMTNTPAGSKVRDRPVRNTVKLMFYPSFGKWTTPLRATALGAVGVPVAYHGRQSYVDLHKNTQQAEQIASGIDKDVTNYLHDFNNNKVRWLGRYLRPSNSKEEMMNTAATREGWFHARNALYKALKIDPKRPGDWLTFLTRPGIKPITDSLGESVRPGTNSPMVDTIKTLTTPSPPEDIMNMLGMRKKSSVWHEIRRQLPGVHVPELVSGGVLGAGAGYLYNRLSHPKVDERSNEERSYDRAKRILMSAVAGASWSNLAGDRLRRWVSNSPNLSGSDAVQVLKGLKEQGWKGFLQGAIKDKPMFDTSDTSRTM